MKEFIWAVIIFLPSVTMKKCTTPPLTTETKTPTEAFKYFSERVLKFSAEMTQKLYDEDRSSNIFFSPYGIYNALLLSYFIANGKTLTSVEKLLNIPEKCKRETAQMYKVIRDYMTGNSCETPPVQFELANRFFVSTTEEVTNCMQRHFSADLKTVNFSDSPVKEINKFVADVTKKEIENFLTENSINQDTKLALVNAAYFKGTWKNRFPDNRTSDETFYLSQNNTVTVKMMRQKSTFKYLKLQGLGKALQLPYEDTNFSMYILLPFRFTYDVSEIINKLSHTFLKDVVTKCTDRTVAVKLPKFIIEHQLQLDQVLQKMEVGDLFTTRSDLSVLTGKTDIHFTSAIHKSKITVNEEGTTAASATVLSLARSIPTVMRFYCNRPFIYFIYHHIFDSILFLGVYNKPPKENSPDSTTLSNETT